MNILINRGNVTSAKSYPYWDELCALQGHCSIKEVKGILSTQELIDLVNWCDIWISIDTFLPHFCKYHNLKPGIVLWGKSNPAIFGYNSNINLCKPERFRHNQFDVWTNEKQELEDWILPKEIVKYIK